MACPKQVQDYLALPGNVLLAQGNMSLSLQQMPFDGSAVHRTTLRDYEWGYTLGSAQPRPEPPPPSPHLLPRNNHMGGVHAGISATPRTLPVGGAQSERCPNMRQRLRTTTPLQGGGWCALLPRVVRTGGH
jgi:hypothetical protein